MKKNHNTIISKKQEAVILKLVDYFDTEDIKYQFTGGFAGNLYGSQWKLHDIDVETTYVNLMKMEIDFNDFVVQPVQRYIDDEFDIWLLQLEINKVKIDINAIENFIIKPHFILETNIEKAHLVYYQGRLLKTQPLDQIIHYKKLLNRIDDLEELSKLNQRNKHP